MIEVHITTLQRKELALLLLVPRIELAIALDEGEELLATLVELCREAPALLSHVYRILATNHCNDASIALFEAVRTIFFLLIKTFS